MRSATSRLSLRIYRESPEGVLTLLYNRRLGDGDGAAIEKIFREENQGTLVTAVEYTSDTPALTSAALNERVPVVYDAAGRAGTTVMAHAFSPQAGRPHACSICGWSKDNHY